MKFYELETKLDFGVFEGKSLKEAIEIETTYLDFCLINVDDFYVSNTTLQEIKNTFSNFVFSNEAETKLTEKEGILSNAFADEDYPDDGDSGGGGGYYYDDDDNGSYSRYGGGPTGDLSDDFINDVLDGNPDAYWNID